MCYYYYYYYYYYYSGYLQCNGAVSSCHAAFGEWIMNWKGCEREWSLCNLLCCPGIFLERLRKTDKVRLASYWREIWTRKPEGYPVKCDIGRVPWWLKKWFADEVLYFCVAVVSTAVQPYVSCPKLYGGFCWNTAWAGSQWKVCLDGGDTALSGRWGPTFRRNKRPPASGFKSPVSQKDVAWIPLL